MSRISTLSAALIEAASIKGITLCTAESCTGGWIGKSLTDIAGSSAAYAGGFVTYSNAAKMRALSVPKDAFADGAVSEPVAIAMAEGARKALKTTMAVSVTGVAGPGGGTAKKPVGTVWFALSITGRQTQAICMNFQDRGRKSVRKDAVIFALQWMLDNV